MTAESLTVMLLAPNLEIGGAQESLRTLAAALPKAGCPVVVCAFGGGPLAEEIEGLGVPLAILPARRHSVLALPSFLRELWQRRRDLVRLVATHRVEVVQTFGHGTLIFLAMTLALTRKVRVWWRIGNVSFMVRAEHAPRLAWILAPKRAVHRRLYRAGARIVDGIVAVSDETAVAFREQVGDVGGKVVVLPSGVDLDRYPAAIDRDAVRADLGFGPDDHVMTMVGTFKRQKGHESLVAAVAAAQHRSLHLVLVGDGELAGTVRRQVADAGLEGRIHFLGSRRDVPAVLAASDSFVLPSLWEGMSVALVEAMASGLPVIATAASGTTRVMVDGVTGWLVPPGDVGGLANAMKELTADPARAARMGAAARTRVVDLFGARAHAERLAAWYRARRGTVPAGPETARTGEAG